MLHWLRKRFGRFRPPTDLEQARRLVRSIELGGVPLDPCRINTIARRLGMEVSRRAPVDQTIERIRAWVARADSHAVSKEQPHGRDS